MRKIKEVLRLHALGWGTRRIAASCSIGRTTVSEYLGRAVAGGLEWPLPPDLSDGALEQRLFPPPPHSRTPGRPEPSWAEVHRELRRKGVTLGLLWQEYKSADPEGFQYSWFCEQYRGWAKRCDLSMRQEHRAGEKLFVDYAGQSADVIDPDTGEVHPAQIFVAVLGASNYTYAEATWTQQLPDWIGAHIRAFAFLGGVPEIVVPDNTRCAVTDPHLYEPDLNPTYQDLATHYDVAVIPARSRRPKDKAKVEAGVLLVERWILAALRNRRFFSLVELNEAIAELLIRLNQRRFKRLPETRQSLFETLDRPVLRPLPPTHYEFADWCKVRPGLDYHVDIERHYYSVPCSLARRQLEARLTDRTVEVFHRGERVASHRRSSLPGRFTTVNEHMPPAHRHQAEWTPERIRRWAEKSGEETGTLIEAILLSRHHPQQGFRSCVGILRLAKRYGDDRLEAAAGRANAIGARSYRSVASILENGLDRHPLPGTDPEQLSLEHENVRGAAYYRSEGDSIPC